MAPLRENVLMSDPADSMRIDKWLWVSRFFKTRALATTAINGGKVHMNGTRIKPSRQLRVGDVLSIHKGPYRFEITVAGLSKQRRPAEEARSLYTESAASADKRHALYRQRKLEGHSARQRQRKPDKRTRRLIRKFRES